MEVPLGSFHKTHILDLAVQGAGVYELKTVDSFYNSHIAQLMTYLYLLDVPRGKLVNFRSGQVESRIVNAPLSRRDRPSSRTETDHFDVDHALGDLTVAMLRDLGTALSGAMYQDVITELLGEHSRVEVHLAMAIENNLSEPMSFDWRAGMNHSKSRVSAIRRRTTRNSCDPSSDLRLDPLVEHQRLEGVLQNDHLGDVFCSTDAECGPHYPPISQGSQTDSNAVAD